MLLYRHSLTKKLLTFFLFIIVSPLCLATDSDPDFERSNHYKAWTKVLEKNFEIFKKEHAEEDKVMIFGTGHDQEARFSSIPPHPKNVFMVDIDLKAGPDLLMNTDIEQIPNEYIGQFNIVIFEGFQNIIEQGYIAYSREKSFSNVYKILKENGIFLLHPENDREDQLKALQGSGFEYVSEIKAPNEEAQYVGCMALAFNTDFLKMKKVDRNETK